MSTGPASALSPRRLLVTGTWRAVPAQPSGISPTASGASGQGCSLRQSLWSWAQCQEHHFSPCLPLTGPGRVQPVLYVQDLFIFRPAVRLLTDPVVFGDFFLESERRQGRCEQPDPRSNWTQKLAPSPCSRNLSAGLQGPCGQRPKSQSSGGSHSARNLGETRERLTVLALRAPSRQGDQHMHR